MTGLVTQSNAISFTSDQVNLIKRTVARGATDDELKLFLYQAERTKLDPFSRQIYFQKYKDKNGRENMTIITGIDGYRAIAERSGNYAGSDDPVFDIEADFADFKASDGKFPRKATVTVYKMIAGQRCGFTASARWMEYFPGDLKGFMWKKMPHTMLGKCAEALALRKAFPNDLSGIYTKEEMDQAAKDQTVIEASVEPTQHEESPPSPQAELGSFNPLQNGEYRINVGKKYFNKTLSEIPDGEITSYMNYFLKQAEEKKTPLTPAAQEFVDQAARYLRREKTAPASNQTANDGSAIPIEEIPF